MNTYLGGIYDVAVLGAGHAGCEAALACARMGLRTLCLTMNLDSVALMACNPAIGGTSKGHLVRELDALGGEMGAAADDTFIQIRMLNTGKGPAVHSLRAQMDKRRYHERMKRALEREPLLDLRMGECERILLEKGRVSGIIAGGGIRVPLPGNSRGYRSVPKEPHIDRRLRYGIGAFGYAQGKFPLVVPYGYGL